MKCLFEGKLILVSFRQLRLWADCLAAKEFLECLAWQVGMGSNVQGLLCVYVCVCVCACV